MLLSSLGSAVLPSIARGDDGPATEPKGATNAAAEAHYKRARELYSLGRYREAIAQLEAALRSDPNGAELLYNLALVHEKLGEADEAIAAYRHYLQVLGSDADPEEVSKIKGTIRRLQGAKDELRAREAKRTEHRFTPLSVSLLVGAGVAVIACGVFGGLALHDDKSAQDYVVTSPSGLLDRQSIVDSSKRNAIFADVFGGLALAAGGAALTLYFTSEFSAKDDPRVTALAPRVTLSGMLGGGNVRLELSF